MPRRRRDYKSVNEHVMIARVYRLSVQRTTPPIIILVLYLFWRLESLGPKVWTSEVRVRVVDSADGAWRDGEERGVRGSFQHESEGHVQRGGLQKLRGTSLVVSHCGSRESHKYLNVGTS